MENLKVGDVVVCTKGGMFYTGKSPTTTGVVVFVSQLREDYYLVKFNGWTHGHGGNYHSGAPHFSGNSCWWLYGRSLTLVDEFNGNV
jgi:hypothetical protein